MPITRRVRIDWGRLALILGAVAIVVLLFNLDLRDAGGDPSSTGSVSAAISSSGSTHAPSTDEDAATDRRTAETPRTDEAPRLTGAGRVAIRVEEDDGSAAAGAEVRLVAHYVYGPRGEPLFDLSRRPTATPLQGRTDAEGRCEFASVPAGWSAQVFVQRGEWAGRSATLNILDGRTYEPVVRLRPAAPVVVHVRDADGEPVPDVEVRSVVPDVTGTIVAAGASYGFPCPPTSREGGTLIFPPVAPEAMTLQGAEPAALALHVAAEGFLPRELTIPPPVGESPPPTTVVLTRSFSLHGTLVDGAGEPHARAMVRLQRPSPGTPQADVWPEGLPTVVRTDEEGRFVLHGLPALGVRLNVAAAGAAQVQVDVPPTKERELDLGRITVKRRSHISGRVLLPDGTPAAGAQVRLMATSPSATPSLTRADADGEFVLTDSGTGGHRLVASDGPGGRHFAPLEGTVEDVPAGATDVEIRLSAARLLRLEIAVATPDKPGGVPPLVGVLVHRGAEPPAGLEPDTWLQRPRTIRLRLDGSGPHGVLVRAKGYRTFLGTVEVDPERETVLRVTLESAGSEGEAGR